MQKNLFIVTVIILTLAQALLAQRKEPKKTEIRGHTMYTVLEPGDIPAIFEPQFLSIAESEKFYYDDEPLIVVTSGDEAKGYSTWHLDHHEIVNDYIDGTAIAVTW